jgi:hypothetical protein
MVEMCSAWVKTGVFLFGNPHARELARQVGEVGDLDAGDVVEIAGIVAVAADAVGDLADPRRDVVDGLVKLLPQVRNAGAAVFMGAALGDAGDQKRLAGFETRGLEIVEQG